MLSSVPLHAVLTDQRAPLMEEITRRVNARTTPWGVEVVDVRIKRADLPQANSQSVYNRMKTDREREAGQIRAEGDEEKQRIVATADREVSVIKAEARLKAQVTMGDAEAEGEHASTPPPSTGIRASTVSTGAWRPIARPSAAAVRP